MTEPATAELVAGMAIQTTDTVHQRELMAMLARRLSGEWNAARSRPKVLEVINQSMLNPALRLQGIALAVATRDARYRETLEGLAQNVAAPEEVQVAAVEALGSLRMTSSQVLDRLIASVRGKSSSSPVAEAAVRASAGQSAARGRMTEILSSPEFPLGLRREALKTLVQLQDGGMRVIELAKATKLPDDLKNEATTLLHTSHVRQVREAAAATLPLPKTAAGQTLPPIGELIRRHGDVEKGRSVFFRAGTNSCSGCHRVQGAGSGSDQTYRRLA